jgi:hypothetical protein
MKKKNESILLVIIFTLILGLRPGWPNLLIPDGMWDTADQAQPKFQIASSTATDRGRATAALRKVAPMFVENVGQFDPRARFQVRGHDTALYLVEQGLWITRLRQGIDTSAGPKATNALPSSGGINLQLSFVGANPHPRLEPFHRMETRVSYFTGDDPANWRTNEFSWGGVRYVDLYPGVDLVVSGADWQWAWRLVARKGADSTAPAGLGSPVRLRVEGADGLALVGDHLKVTTALGDFTIPLLQVTGRTEVSLARPSLAGNQVTNPFASSGTNVHMSDISSQATTTDLSFSTFLGGSGSDGHDPGSSIAVDTAGNVYVTGKTLSIDFPTTPGAFTTSPDGGLDAFVVKLNADGSGLAYATYLGGTGSDSGYAIAVDIAGNAYVTGHTKSSNFPITSQALDTTLGGTQDAFVVKLDADGTGLVYATFLGGSLSELGSGITVNGSGKAYVTGHTQSPDFPMTEGSFDRTHNGAEDIFVVKLNATGSRLTYATFLGGSGSDGRDPGPSIAIDKVESIYVTGYTESADFPTTAGAFDTTQNGSQDAFVVKLRAHADSGLAYATFLGGIGSDFGFAIAVDEKGRAYVTGQTSSTNFPSTAGAFDTTHNGSQDAFVVKLNAAGSLLAFATFLGGGLNDGGRAIAVDGNDSVYVTGYAESADFPTTAGALDTTHNGSQDAFVAKLRATADSGLAYATFLGGTLEDRGHAVAADSAGNAYVMGRTESPDFPSTAGAFATSLSGFADITVTKLALGWW